jgi:hypothetical protein
MTGDLIFDAMNGQPFAVFFALFTMACIAGVIWSGIESERS